MISLVYFLIQEIVQTKKGNFANSAQNSCILQPLCTAKKFMNVAYSLSQHDCAIQPSKLTRPFK